MHMVNSYPGYLLLSPPPTVRSLRPVPCRERLHSQLPQDVHVISVRGAQLRLEQRLHRGLRLNRVSGLLCCTGHVPVR